MTYAERLGATHIVDVATLTGAVSRAFGHLSPAASARRNAWWDDVMGAADKAAERYWRIPLVDEYQTEMESWYGDIINSGSAEGSLVKSRHLPARVPDRAVGPPRHRRHRLLPQDDAVGGARRDRRDPRDARRAGARRGEGLTPLVAALAVGGALFGVVADRVAVRWPEHDEEHPAGRAIGWRTVASAAIGAFAFALLDLRLGRRRARRRRCCSGCGSRASSWGSRWTWTSGCSPTS